MKKLAAFIFAVVAMVAGVVSTPAVSVSATDIMLTKEETRALFSDHILCNYKVSSNTLQSMSFDFYGYGTIGDFNSTPVSGSFWYDPSGLDCVIYRGSDTPTIPFYDDSGRFDIQIFPVIDLSSLNSIKFSSGLSTNASYDVLYSFPQSFVGAKFPSFSMYINDSLATSRCPFYLDSQYNRYPTSVSVNAGALNKVYNSAIAQFVYSSDTVFRAFCTGDGYSGYHQGYGVSKATNAIDSDFGQYYYLFISTVELSSGYVNNIPPESSGGGSESSGGSSESSGGGYDGPDYTDQLALILAKLDLIINNDFNFDVDLSADLSGLESRLDGVNSRLDGVNSLFDGNNSRLDGVNSRLDGVNSRLDNINGELHDLNSAPSETIPNTGGENSEFEHQAEMYMSDFRNEFEDSENQVFEVINKGTGFLGFVRQFIISSHLAQILPLVALLFIAHYVIFERGG